MERTDRRSRGFIGYEYKEITADMGQISFLIDGYVNFGWEVDENVAQPALETFPKRAGAMQRKKAVLRLKRDRKITIRRNLQGFRDIMRRALPKSSIWRIRKLLRPLSWRSR